MRKLFIALVAATATVATPLTIASANHHAAAPAAKTIVDVASENENFTTLTALLIKADLAQVEKVDGRVREVILTGEPAHLEQEIEELKLHVLQSLEDAQIERRQTERADGGVRRDKDSRSTS